MIKKKHAARRFRTRSVHETLLREESAIRKLTIEELQEDQFQNALMTLSPREGRVLQLRFGWRDGKERTLKEIGEKFGVTSSSIREIETVAVKKLRLHLAKSTSHTQEEFLGIGVFEGRIKIVSLSKDGQYRFEDEMDRIHNILYVVSTEALAIKTAIEELEFLLNDSKATEQDFQNFFEKNPRLILNDAYKRAHPHITLTREEGPLIPDFLLEPLDQNSLCDILDLKLPSAKIFVLKRSRLRYSAAVMEACAQLREYNNYFDEKENRDRIFRKYGLLAYKPKMIVIIGRKGGIDPISFRKIESDLPQLVLRTYDDILNRAKNRLQEFA